MSYTFNDENIKPYTTETSVHADVFNATTEKLLENTKYNKVQHEALEKEMLEKFNELDFFTKKEVIALMEKGLKGDKGEQGTGLEYQWNQTLLGIKTTEEKEFTFVDLKGDKGQDGTVTFDELTEEQRLSLKGDAFTYEDFTKEQLELLKGEDGKDGLTTEIELNGNVYTQENGLIKLPDYPSNEIAELEDKIHILSEKVSINKIYTAFTQINESCTVTTPIATLFGWMESNSIAMLEVSAPNTNVYPARYGICIIHKSNANRNSIEFVDAMTGNKYVGACHSSFENGFSGWKLCSSITSTLTLLNGWATSDSYDDLIVCRSGNLVNIHGTLKKESAVIGGGVIAILPDIYRPTVLRRSIGTAVDSNASVAMDINSAGEISYWGKASDSISSLRIDITYAI